MKCYNHPTEMEEGKRARGWPATTLGEAEWRFPGLEVLLTFNQANENNKLEGTTG